MTCGRSVVFSGHSVSCINKTDRQDIAEIMLKVTLDIIPPPPPPNCITENAIYGSKCDPIYTATIEQYVH